MGGARASNLHKKKKKAKGSETAIPLASFAESARIVAENVVEVDGAVETPDVSATKEALGRRLMDTQKQLLKLQLQAKLQELEKLKSQTQRTQATHPAVSSHPPMRPVAQFRPPMRVQPKAVFTPVQPKAVFTPAATSPGKSWPVTTTSPQKTWPAAKA